MTRSWARLQNQRGFLLAQLLMSLAMVGLLMAAVFIVQRQGQEAYLLGASRVETQQNARVALDVMTRELRSASSVTSISSSSDVTLKDQCGQSVEYALAEGQLNRTGPNYSDRSACVFATTNTTTIIGGVRSLSLSYFDTTMTATTDPTKVYAIKISLTAGTEQTAAPGSAGDQQATMECMVKLRATLS